MNSRRRSIPALLALLVPAAAAFGQRLEFGSSITVVTLPVFVTDGAGRAVAGLRKEDFEVLDDGRPVAIAGFREIDAEEAVAATPLGDSPAARRQFLLLFDLSFSGVSGLVRSRQAAVSFIEDGLAPSDLAAVATFSANHGVKLLVGFTSDRRQLRKAVETLGVLQLDRRADPLGLAYDLTDVGAALADTIPEETGNAVQDALRAIQIRYQRSEEAVYRRRVLALLDGMAQLAGALDALQGRKQVVFLSSGFDPTALVGEQPAQAMRDSEAVVAGRLWEVQSENRFGDAEIRQEMTRMVRSFSSSDSVVHAVDISGLSARGDTRQQGSEPRSRSGQESLAEIANLSGGRLFKDTNDLGLAFGEILEMSRRYYLLAFEPPDPRGPGRFHKLKVRLRGKGRRVSHRSGYFERPPYAERTPLARKFEAAEIIAKGVTGGEITLKALAIPYRAAGGRVTLPVVVEAEGGSLLGQAAGGKLGLEIYGYALDERGSVEDVVAVASNLDLAKVGPKLRERGLQCHATFSLPPGKHSLRFLFRDAETGRSGSHWLEVQVPPFAAGEVLLFPPLFMDDPGRWVVVQAPSGRAGAPESPFRVAAELFAPRARPRLANGRPERVFLLAFDGGRQYDPAASFEIKAQLLDGSGSPVTGGAFQLARTSAESDGYHRFVLNFTPEGLAPGPYTLRVRLRDPASGRLSEAFQAVAVE